MTVITPRPQWDTAPLYELIRHIVSHHHERLRTELPALATMAGEVEDHHRGESGCPHGASRRDSLGGARSSG
jgi:iron-sulfur cluster repair protein YtfE (RIC family)